MKLFIAFVTFLVFSNAYACIERDATPFLNKSRFPKPAFLKKVTPNATIQDAQDILEKFKRVYGQTIKEQFDAELEIRKLYDVYNVRFSIEPSKFFIEVGFMYLKLTPFMTTDALISTFCHEMGHPFGGKPYYPGAAPFPGMVGNSCEGQADYYANAVCMKEILKNEDNKKFVKEHYSVPAQLKQDCQKQYPNENDYYLCVRASLAGILSEYGYAYLAGSDIPRPHKKVGNVASQVLCGMDLISPVWGSQCRVNTYFQASLCQGLGLVPDPDKAVCEDKKSGRPACWYPEQ